MILLRLLLIGLLERATAEVLVDGLESLYLV